MMLLFFLYTIILIIYLSFKSILPGNIPVPDLALILIFFIATTAPLKNSYKEPLFTFIIGIIKDIFSGGIIGSTSVSLIMVLIASHLLSERIGFQGPLARLSGVAFMYIVKIATLYIILEITGLGLSPTSNILFSAIVTIIFADILFRMLAKIDIFIRGKTDGGVAF